MNTKSISGFLITLDEHQFFKVSICQRASVWAKNFPCNTGPVWTACIHHLWGSLDNKNGGTLTNPSLKPLFQGGYLDSGQP